MSLSANADDNPAVGRCENCKIVVFQSDIEDGSITVQADALGRQATFKCPETDKCDVLKNINSKSLDMHCVHCWAYFLPTDAGEGDISPIIASKNEDGTCRCAVPEGCRERQSQVLNKRARSGQGTVVRKPPDGQLATSCWDIEKAARILQEHAAQAAVVAEINAASVAALAEAAEAAVPVADTAVSEEMVDQAQRTAVCPRWTSRRRMQRRWRLWLRQLRRLGDKHIIPVYTGME